MAAILKPFTIETSSKIEGLNLIRFFAFFWVFCAHTLPGALPTDSIINRFIISFSIHGNFGVDLFFVLSSFLLTYLGLVEKSRTGKFSVKNFLIRRSLRIFPLYYLVVLGSYILFPAITVFTGKAIHLPDNILYYLFFVSNYYSADHIFALKFLWSIAVEEQFYWSWAFSLLIAGKRFLSVALFYLGIYLAIFFVLYPLDIKISDATLLYFANFSIGSLCAIIFFHYKEIAQSLKLLLPTMVGSFICWILSRGINSYFAQIFLSVVFAALLLTAIRICSQDLIKRNFIYKLFDKLGTYTYGLYVYSGFVITLATILIKYSSVQINAIVLFFTQFVFTLIIAFCSYNWYEIKFLNYSKKYK